MEVLVFSFRPHVIQGLFGNVKILGLTQSTTLRENAQSANENCHDK